MYYSSDYEVITGFTVTLSGGFLLSSMAGYGFTETSCNDGGCLTNPTDYSFSAELSGSIQILNSVGDAVFSQALSASGSTYLDECCGAGGVYFGTLSLGDSASGLVDLGTGEYTLDVIYSDETFADQSGATSPGSEVESNLVPNPGPTPEPRELWLLIAGLATLFLAKVRRGLRHRRVAISDEE